MSTRKRSSAKAERGPLGSLGRPPVARREQGVETAVAVALELPRSVLRWMASRSATLVRVVARPVANRTRAWVAGGMCPVNLAN